MALLRVRNKQTGKTGTLDTDKTPFDPRFFEQLKDQTVENREVFGKYTKGDNLLASLLDPVAKIADVGVGSLLEIPRAIAVKADPEFKKESTRKIAEMDNPFISEQQLDTGATGFEALKRLLNPIDERGQGARQAVGETARAGAGLVSYGIPFGGGGAGKGASALTKKLIPEASTFIGKTVVPGAVSGGLFAASDEDAGLGDVAAGAGFGALGASLFGGGANLLNAGKNLLTKTGSKVSQNVADDAASALLKASPTTFKKAASRGIDINKVVQKYVPGFSSVDDIIGTVADRGKGGIISSEISGTEKIINNAIKNSGDDIVATVDDIVAPLLKERSKLVVNGKVVPGKTQQLAQLDGLIAETRNFVGKGMKADELLNLKRLFDNQFGASVVDDATGAIVRDAQKKLANTSRKILKDRFKTIKNALDKESELLTIRPILQHAQAIENTGGSTIRRGSLAALDLTKPGTAIDMVTRQPKVASALAQAGNVSAPKISGPQVSGDSLQKLSALLGANLSGGGQANSLPEGASFLPPGQEAPGGGDMGAIQDQIQQAKLWDLLNNGGKGLAQIEALEKTLIPPQEKLTQAQQAKMEVADLTEEALSDLQNKDIKIGPLGLGSRLEQAKGLFDAADQDTLTFNTRLASIKAAIAKARAGTSFTPNEEKLLNRYTPEVGDSRQQIETKLNLLNQFFASKSFESSPEEQLMQFLQTQQ